MRSKENLYLSLRAFQRCVALHLHTPGSGRFPTFCGRESNCPSSAHNLCFRCPNGSCKAIFDIYTSRPFQQYKEHFKARCFALCCRAIKLRESWRTLNSHFWECESHPRTCLKMGLRQNVPRVPNNSTIWLTWTQLGSNKWLGSKSLHMANHAFGETSTFKFTLLPWANL
jgi:hypothetical protein